MPEDAMKAMPDVATLNVWLETAISVGGSLLLAIVILAIGWNVSKAANRAVLRGTERAKVERTLGQFAASGVQYTILGATALAALERVGIQTTSLVAVFASVGFAVGMALQGSLGNFASGVMLLLFRPFRVDDVVDVGGQVGLVTDIGLFATRLLTLDNVTIIVPNGAITGGVITNFTHEGTLRVIIGVGVAYGSNVDQVTAVLLKAARAVDMVLDDPAPAVVFTDMAASAITFDVRVWVKAAHYHDIQHPLRKALYEALNEARIEIPFDQIVVHRAST